MARPGRSFGFLWASTALSNVADGLLKVGAPLLAVSLTRSPSLVSLVQAAATAPWLLFALHAGAFADRADRRRVMVTANAARAVVLAGAAAAAASGLLDLWTLVVAALLAGVAEVFADTSAQSILPMTVPDARLTQANGRVMGAQMIGNEFTGAPAAGLLAGLLPAALFGGPAVLYAAAGLLLLGMRGTYRATPAGATGDGGSQDGAAGAADGGGRARRSLFGEIREALRFLWEHRLLRGLAVSAGLLNLANAAYFAVFVLWCVGDGSAVGLGPGAYGLIMTAMAVGAVGGSLLSSRAARALGEARTLLGAWLATALLLLVPVAAPTPWALYPTAVLWGLTGAAGNVLVISARQRLIPGPLLGRVNSAYRLVGMGGMPFGAALGGVAAEFAGLAPVLLCAAAVCLGAVGLARRALSDRISGALTSTATLSDISRSR
ncbi:MFS transporter [Nonomuraea pusilla]|uniref:MFS transporter n=1 Tax=Nonomuraea pusilla TaxID=46177 RepID=UPI0033200CE0